MGATLKDATVFRSIGLIGAPPGGWRPRDYDLAVGGGTLALETREEFRSRAAEILGGNVDLVELIPSLPSDGSSTLPGKTSESALTPIRAYAWFLI